MKICGEILLVSFARWDLIQLKIFSWRDVSGRFFPVDFSDNFLCGVFSAKFYFRWILFPLKFSSVGLCVMVKYFFITNPSHNLISFYEQYEMTFQMCLIPVIALKTVVSLIDINTFHTLAKRGHLEGFFPFPFIE